MRILTAIFGLIVATGATGAAHADEALRWGKKAGTTPVTILTRRDVKLDGTMLLFGKEQPMRTFRSSEAEEREVEGGQLDLRFSKIVDESGDVGRDVWGKAFVVGEDPRNVRAERKVIDAVSSHARAHRRDAALTKWLATQSFVRDQPVKVSVDELRKLMGPSSEWELRDGTMSIVWTGTQGATAKFRIELELDVKSKESAKAAIAHLKLAGTLSADVATANIVDTDLTGAMALQSIIRMNATVMIHERRR